MESASRKGMETMPPRNPYQEPQGSDKTQENIPPRESYTGIPNLDSAVSEIVQAGAELGSGVLDGLAGVVQTVGDAIRNRGVNNKEIPFATWRQRMDRKLKNDDQDGYLGMAVGGWIFAGGFGIAGVIMFILAMVEPQALGMLPEEHVVFPVLASCFIPVAVGFSVMGAFGVRLWGRYNRLRGYLRAARDWTCDIADIARDTMQPQDRVREELQKAITSGKIPGALISADGKTLYLNDALYIPPEPPAEPVPQDKPKPDKTDGLRREGVDFLNYLRACRGHLGEMADEELSTMQKTCGAILDFAHNHPDQQPRLRRFRDYYLPTTRKLLDTALGLGDTDAAAAEKIRGDITGILHTLNLAYANLYETLLQDVSLDVSTEIDTLETMLRQDGLTHDFGQDFGTGTKNVNL